MADRWHDENLDRFARSVSYSVRTCVVQLATIVEKYGNLQPEAFRDPTEDALLEAGLMKVRALDEYLKGGSRPTDIRPSDWVEGWQPKHWLDPRVRSQIDWQVAHLSSMSSMEFPKFRIAECGAALCEEIERFYALVEHKNPDRMPPFEEGRAAAIWAKQIFEKAL
jgi:hypothetical protein